MANVKTAISLPEALFEEVEALSSDMRISRSGVFVLALEEFVARRRNRQLLDQLNRAYGDPRVATAEADVAARRVARRQHRKVVSQR